MYIMELVSTGRGKLTATTPGDAFKHNAALILSTLGPLPHARLNATHSTGPKKQGTRLLKALCPTCGYKVRVTRQWLDKAGAPHCPDHGSMEVDGWEPEDEGED